jgi:hypothetical protein
MDVVLRVVRVIIVEHMSNVAHILKSKEMVSNRRMMGVATFQLERIEDGCLNISSLLYPFGIVILRSLTGGLSVAENMPVETYEMLQVLGPLEEDLGDSLIKVKRCQLLSCTTSILNGTREESRT